MANGDPASCHQWFVEQIVGYSYLTRLWKSGPFADVLPLLLGMSQARKIVPGRPLVAKMHGISSSTSFSPDDESGVNHGRCHSRGPHHGLFNFGLDRAQQRIGTSRPAALYPYKARSSTVRRASCQSTPKELAPCLASQVVPQKGQFPGFGRSVRN
jgi:hypothetical protein